ncbi:MAG: aspartyl/asparaginyl beta-hydroxylase domain-containing protein [Parvularculaceae bacterium]
MNATQDAAADGLKALQAGDVQRAFTLLSEAVSGGAGGRNAYMALAIAARETKRPGESLAAIERVLKIDPGNLEALIIKADALAAQGNERRAAAFYLAAVNAAQSVGRLSGQLAIEIERARKECAAAAIRYEEYLRDRVKRLGLFDGSGRARGEQALDVLFGRKQIYFQQPEKFFFPELPQVQFYDPSNFAWTEDVIAATDDILEELNIALKERDRFEPYVPANAKTPHLHRHEMMGNENWGALHLIKDGVRIEENIKFCPATLAALENAPAPNVPGKSPITLFSRLTPGTHIPPHTGLLNTRLICHLPVIAPEGCTIRVGNQERVWRMGEMLIFDDSIEHEARNNGASDRVVLLFDIWRPELSEEERAFVSTVFDAIEDYGVF